MSDATTPFHSSYPLEVRWAGERTALATSTDGLPQLEIAPPPQFGGPGGRWSPEHLLVASAASCWMTTFLAIAAYSHLTVLEVSAAGEGFVDRDEDRRFFVRRIELRPRVTVSREEDREQALRLIRKAEDGCLIARSLRTTVELAPEVSVRTAA